MTPFGWRLRLGPYLAVLVAEFDVEAVDAVVVEGTVVSLGFDGDMVCFVEVAAVVEVAGPHHFSAVVVVVAEVGRLREGPDPVLVP